LPAPSGTELAKTPGAHAPIGIEAIVPSPSALYHSSVQPGMSQASSPSISWFHTPVHFVVPSSARSMVTDSPSVSNGVPLACQIMLVAKPASPLSLTMHELGFSWRIVRPASTYSSQVVGTSSPTSSKTSLL